MTKKIKTAKKTTKAAETVEVLAPVTETEIAAHREQLGGILRQVAQDINNAELGRFFALRAGVGLVVTREYIPHGEWSEEIQRAFPNRHPATIRRYMADARDFLAERKLVASDIWARLVAVDQMLLTRAASQLLLGEPDSKADKIPAREIPAEVRMMADYLQGGEQQPRDGATTAEGKSLTASEKRLAAQALWQRLAATVTAEGIARKSWQLLDAETQETVASALRTSADEILRAVRKSKTRADEPKI